MITAGEKSQCILLKRRKRWGPKKAQAPSGFEPLTSCLLDRRSNQLSYGALVGQEHEKLINNLLKFMMVGKCFPYYIRFVIKILHESREVFSGE